MVDLSAIGELVETIKEPVQDTNRTYDAVVSRKDTNGVVWVRLAGAEKETPTATTSAEVERGDAVSVEWRNNRLYIVGNATNPSAGIGRVEGIESAMKIANEAASNAVQSAGEAYVAAEDAKQTAAEVHGIAVQAQEDAAEASTAAGNAGRAASMAQTAAEAAQATADAKKTVFITEPTPPYHVGDLWAKLGEDLQDMIDSAGNNFVDSSGDLFQAAILKEATIYVCTNPKLEDQSFSESDWELATADSGLREWFWHDAAGAHILGDVTGFRNDLTSTGMNIVDTSTETSVAQFGSSVARIGTDNVGQGRIEIASDGLRIYKKATAYDDNQIANIGYGEVVTYGGSPDYGPYYTFGQRNSSLGHTTIGYGSVVAGSMCEASEENAFAEGSSTHATGYDSHAEGIDTEATGQGAHAEGSHTHANGNHSHAEGSYTYAVGRYSHAQNRYTKALSDNQTALGKYNVEDDQDTYAVIIGNGTADNARSNALTVDWSGNVEAVGEVIDGNGNSIPIIEEVRDTTSVTISANSGSGSQTYTPTKSGYTLINATFAATGNAGLLPYECHAVNGHVAWAVRNVTSSSITSTARRFTLTWIKS